MDNIVIVKSPQISGCSLSDLYMTCSKDPYPLPNIDRLTNKASGYKIPSVMNVYSRNN